MLQFLRKNQKAIILISLLAVIATYFIFGWYNISNVGISVDEPAHFGASQAYSQHQGTNLEHPVLTKSITGVVLSLAFPNMQSQTGGPYERGKEFLLSPNYDYDTILATTRSVTLIFNSLLLFFILVYTYVIKFIPPKLSLILSILYTFSPSFTGHNFLVTFDVSGASTALMTIISLLHLFKNVSKIKLSHFLGVSALVSFVFLLAFHTKFTNIILLLPLAITWVAIIIRSILQKNTQKDIKIWLKLLCFSLIFGVINYLGLWILYSYSFGNVTYSGSFVAAVATNSWLKPIAWYYEGVKLSASRSTDIIPGFVNDDFRVQTFKGFVFRLFWFKENVGLFILAFVASLAMLYRTIKNLLKNSATNYDIRLKIKTFLAKHQQIIWYSFIASIYPVAYIILSWGSFLTIGYRHFYPVLIFIYFGTAVLVYLSRLKNILLASFLIIYIIFGDLGLGQNISYVNPLWTKEKWHLATDSSINWVQELPLAYKYLATQNLLTPENKGKIINATWNACIITPEDWVEKYSDFKRQGDGDYYNYYYDLTQKDIKISGAKYLVLDTFVWQHMSSKAKSNSIAKSNMEYISTLKPFYSSNDVITIYKL